MSASLAASGLGAPRDAQTPGFFGNNALQNGAFLPKNGGAYAHAYAHAYASLEIAEVIILAQDLDGNTLWKGFEKESSIAFVGNA